LEWECALEVQVAKLGVEVLQEQVNVDHYFCHTLMVVGELLV
jgi:hypothetical protein